MSVRKSLSRGKGIAKLFAQRLRSRIRCGWAPRGCVVPSVRAAAIVARTSVGWCVVVTTTMSPSRRVQAALRSELRDASVSSRGQAQLIPPAAAAGRSRFGGPE
jgi:hypothetical protein